MTHSNMPEMKVVAKTLRKEREDVLDWWRWSLTSAILEGLSSVIQSARRAAREFRNTGCFETTIFLRLGRLDFPTQVAVSSANYKKQRRAQKSNAHEGRHPALPDASLPHALACSRAAGTSPCALRSRL